MIPKIIWQTYKTYYPPVELLDSIKSWLILNPQHQWYYMDDLKCEEFILDHFSIEFINMYKSLPFGVMKSDAWRIAVVYIYGGIYCDTDTICLKPIDEWITDKDLVISIEPHTQNNIANYCFAATPKHPALLFCLEQLIINYNSDNFMDKITATGSPIQNYGQHAFDYGIKKYFNHDLSNIDSNTKIFSIEDNAFTPTPTNHSLVHHQTASIFSNSSYESWRKEQKKQFGY